MESFNYNAFQFNDKNRIISQKNVDNIKKSILEIGFIKQRPVLINKEKVIIDGHHRFLALKSLGLPITYEIEEDLSQREMILLNSSQKSWMLEDFIRFYAKDNIKFYTEVLSVYNDYNFSITNCLIICTSLSTPTAGMAKLIREGNDFQINERLDELIELILFINSQVGYTVKKDLVYVLKIVLNKLNKKQLEKLKDGFSSMREQTSSTNYLITFENIINKRMGNDNKVNLLNK